LKSLLKYGIVYVFIAELFLPLTNSQQNLHKQTLKLILASSKLFEVCLRGGKDDQERLL